MKVQGELAVKLTGHSLRSGFATESRRPGTPSRSSRTRAGGRARPFLCANRTVVRSATYYLGVPSKGWVAHCIACAAVKYGVEWRETYDWADEHSSRGWTERRWIPHTMTFTNEET